jgi:hypothetical protein
LNQVSRKRTPLKSVCLHQSISGSRGQNYTQLGKLLYAQENKQTLVNSFRPLSPVQPGHMLYVVGIFGNPEVVKVFSEQIVTDYPELCSSQEEADTRMILQALHVDKKKT